MYHHIGKPPAGADEYRRDLTVSPTAFEEQLRTLKEEGYQTIGLNDLTLHLTTGKELPKRSVILTFDDGYRDAYTQAYPLLQRYGFTATFFLTTKPIDGSDPEWLSWEQVSAMHAAGMEFEPHSYDHPDMRGRSFEFLVYQILASKGAIEARTGEPCRFFAYPSGRYDDFVIDVLRSASFWGAVLTEQGATHTSDGLFTLRRVRVHGDADLGTFVRTLRLDW
jgi:peptidoglycan/xylan/chitin deacetylase (PgdA/CDA1 family)